MEDQDNQQHNLAVEELYQEVEGMEEFGEVEELNIFKNNLLVVILVMVVLMVVVEEADLLYLVEIHMVEELEVEEEHMAVEVVVDAGGLEHGAVEVVLEELEENMEETEEMEEDIGLMDMEIWHLLEKMVLIRIVGLT